MPADTNEKAPERPVLLIFRWPPHGSVFAAEGFRLAEALLAFEVPLRLAFEGDGVYVLMKGQGGRLGLGDLAGAFSHMPEHGLKEFLVLEEDLKERGLARDDLVDGPVRLIPSDELRSIIDESKVVMPF